MEVRAIKSTFTFLFALLFMFLLVVAENHVPIIEAPSPQPHENGTSIIPHGATQGSLRPEECTPRCAQRCSKTQYKKPCLFFCNKCCATCLCVPPGTYGNKQLCPCYNNWKTKRGGPKCP